MLAYGTSAHGARHLLHSGAALHSSSTKSAVLDVLEDAAEFGEASLAAGSTTLAAGARGELYVKGGRNWTEGPAATKGASLHASSAVSAAWDLLADVEEDEEEKVAAANAEWQAKAAEAVAAAIADATGQVEDAWDPFADPPPAGERMWEKKQSAADTRKFHNSVLAAADDWDPFADPADAGIFVGLVEVEDRSLARLPSAKAQREASTIYPPSATASCESAAPASAPTAVAATPMACPSAPSRLESSPEASSIGTQPERAGRPSAMRVFMQSGSRDHESTAFAREAGKSAKLPEEQTVLERPRLAAQVSVPRLQARDSDGAARGPALQPVVATRAAKPVSGVTRRMVAPTRRTAPKPFGTRPSRSGVAPAVAPFGAVQAGAPFGSVPATAPFVMTPGEAAPAAQAGCDDQLRHAQEALPMAHGLPESRVPGLEHILAQIDAEDELDAETLRMRVYDEEEASRSRELFFGLGVAGEAPGPSSKTLGAADSVGTFGQGGFVTRLLQRNNPEQLEVIQNMQAEATLGPEEVRSWLLPGSAASSGPSSGAPRAGHRETSDAARSAAAMRRNLLGARPGARGPG